MSKETVDSSDLNEIKTRLDAIERKLDALAQAYHNDTKGENEKSRQQGMRFVKELKAYLGTVDKQASSTSHPSSYVWDDQSENHWFNFIKRDKPKDNLQAICKSHLDKDDELKQRLFLIQTKYHKNQPDDPRDEILLYTKALEFFVTLIMQETKK